MQIQDVVLVVSQRDESGGDGCSILHSGGIKVSREPQPNQLVQHQQALHQLQQHISNQHCLAANDLHQLLVEVCSSCCILTFRSGYMSSCYIFHMLHLMLVNTTVPGVTTAYAICCIQYCYCMARCLAGTLS